MGAGIFILAMNVDFNREVLSKGGLYFDREETDLSKKLLWVIPNKENLTEAINFSLSRIKEYYNWDRIADEYMKLIERTSKQ